MLNYPSINPTALSIGPLSIQWYGFMYIIGIVLGTQFCKPYLFSQINSKRNIRPH